MSGYRRAFVPGGCFFFTVVTHGRQRLLDENRNVDRLREGLQRTMEKHPFQIDAIVILPDHLHAVSWPRRTWAGWNSSEQVEPLRLSHPRTSTITLSSVGHGGQIAGGGGRV